MFKLMYDLASDEDLGSDEDKEAAYARLEGMVARVVASVRARVYVPVTDNQLAALKAVYANVGVIHGPLDHFITPTKVDVVWTSDNLHDMHDKFFGGLDIAATNKAIYASLKPGGTYIVIDHRAAKGAGLAAAEALHRMDEDIAKQEVLAAGFKLVSESKLLTRPDDDNTKKIFEQGEHDHTDQMVLKFRKPG
jgi:predicted methyltransferase